MEMFTWLSQFLENDDSRIIYLLTLIMIANIIDFLIGWINAKFNKDVTFSSSKAIFGITRKMIVFMVMVFFIPVSLLVPQPVGVSALFVLFTGYLLSEINSILNHLKISDDDKTNDKFIDFVNTIFKSGGKK